MLRVPLVLAAAFLIGCGADPNLSAPSAPDLSSLPELVREQVQAAYTQFQDAPGDAGAAGNLAMLLDAHGADDQAEPYYSLAATRAPRAMQWLYLHARSLDSLGRTADASSQYRAALELQPGYAPARLRLAAILAEQGQADEAEELYQSVSEIHPRSADASLGLGRLALERDQASDAVRHLERAVALDAQLPGAEQALAEAYGAVGRDADADAAALRAERIPAERPRMDDDPILDLMESLREGDAAERVVRARRLERQGDFSAAEAEYRAALEADSGSVAAHVGLLSVYTLLGDLDAAREHYQEAASIDVEYERLDYNLGVLHVLGDDYGEAAAAFRRAVEQTPHDADAHANLARALELNGQPVEAVARYRAALSEQPLHRLANDNLGRLLLEDGKPEQALPLIERAALVLDQRTPETLLRLARAQDALGREKEAAQTLSRARELAESMDVEIED